MRILLTGYGKLGQFLGKQLSAQHDVTVLEKLPIETELPHITADISVYEDVYAAMEGIDAVIHTAAQQNPRLDPAHHGSFFSSNVTGTFNILQAAFERDVKKLVVSSSIVVCGTLSRGGSENKNRASRLDETAPWKPENIYDLTKVINEQTAEFYARVFGMNVICVRYGGFFAPHEGPGYVKKLLSWYVHTEDVAECVRLAVESDIEGYRLYVITPRICFTDSDSEELVRDPNAVVKRYYPEEYEILQAKGISLDPITMWWDSSKIQNELGFEPKHNFEHEVRRCL